MAFATRAPLPRSARPSHRRRRKTATEPSPGRASRAARGLPAKRGVGVPKPNQHGTVLLRALHKLSRNKGKVLRCFLAAAFACCALASACPAASALSSRFARREGARRRPKRTAGMSWDPTAAGRSPEGRRPSSGGGDGSAAAASHLPRRRIAGLSRRSPPGSRRGGPDHRAEARPRAKAAFTSRSKLSFSCATPEGGEARAAERGRSPHQQPRPREQSGAARKGGLR